MPTPRVLMSKIRQALQLLADSGLSMRQVAAALGVSTSQVSVAAGASLTLAPSVQQTFNNSFAGAGQTA